MTSFMVEYEMVGESQGPSRVIRTDAEVDLQSIVLDGNPKLHPGSRIVVRIALGPMEEESFVGVAVVEVAKSHTTIAKWNLLDTDRVQLEGMLEARAKKETEEAA